MKSLLLDFAEWFELNVFQYIRSKNYGEVVSSVHGGYAVEKTKVLVKDKCELDTLPDHYLQLIHPLLEELKYYLEHFKPKGISSFILKPALLALSIKANWF